MRSVQTVQPFLEDRVLPVPETKGETEPLVVVPWLSAKVRDWPIWITHEIPAIPSSPHRYALLVAISNGKLFHASPFAE